MKTNLYSQDALYEVQKFIKDGTINEQQVNTWVTSMKRKEVEQKHNQSIWWDERGRKYCTHIYIDNKRVIRRRKTKEELLDFLIEYYDELEHTRTIKDVFSEWIDKKYSNGEIKKQSYDRYYTDFNRFFSDKEAICSKSFDKINELDLADFIEATIVEEKLTTKTYAGLRTLINGMFKYGKKMSYTTLSITNFFGDFDLPKTIFNKKKKTDDEQIYSKEEANSIINYLKNNEDIWNLGLLLQFESGLRIGELSSLTWDDIENNIIHVTKTEIKYKDEQGKSKVKVDDSTKTVSGTRNVVINNCANETINKIYELTAKEAYLFTNRGKRIRANTFNKRLYTICKDLGIKFRSTHAIRKYYATTLLANKDIPETFVCSQLGHSDILTTNKYYRKDNISLPDRLDLIEQAINY